METLTPDPPPARAVVTLSRNDERDVRHRQIYARIDDLPNNTLLFGDSVRIEVAPGSHRLKANNTLFWKSVMFDIEPGQHIEFALINRSSQLAFGFLALLGVGPLMLAIERRDLTPILTESDRPA
jgi:hypothetical protein